MRRFIGLVSLVFIVFSFQAALATNSGCLAPESYEDMAKDIVHNKFGLKNLKVMIKHADALEQCQCTGEIGFSESLSEALHSFLNDDTHIESPLSLVGMELGSEDPKYAKALLQDYLDRDTSEIVLVTPSYRFSPEHGELLEKVWAFALFIGDFSDHIYWAIIDRNGEQPVYNYGFN